MWEDPIQGALQQDGQLVEKKAALQGISVKVKPPHVKADRREPPHCLLGALHCGNALKAEVAKCFLVWAVNVAVGE